jgi:hypothetical protein
MPALDYGKGAYTRSRGNLPELPVINMFVEQSGSDGVVLQSHKALVQIAEVGSGPIRATLAKDGVFNGDRFSISGNVAYRGALALGVVDGTGPAYIVASDSEVVFGRGQTAYSYNGTDFQAIVFPDGASVTKVAYTAGYWIFLRADTGVWYFSAIGNARSIDALDFATAENEPDRLLDILILDGVLVLLGTESIEFWGATGDADLPYTPIQQRVFEQGVIATGCAVVVDNTFFWIGRDGITYRNDETPKAVSDDGIVERSQKSTSHRLFLVEDERHKFLCQRHDTNTMLYDVTTQEWCERQSYGRSNWRAGPGLGDDETGKIWKLEGYADDGGVFERRFRAGSRLEAVAIVNNLRLTAETGTTGYLTGDYSEPLIEMRASNDAGNTWSIWEAVSLGAQGVYRERVEWRALGMFDDPGMLFEFRMTAPVSFRLSSVEVNASGGGRSR